MKARVYIISDDAEHGHVIGDYNIKPIDMTDEQFIACAQQHRGAQIYSLEDFNRLFPKGIKLQYSTMRIISV